MGKTAKEMFEELGYKVIISYDDTIVYQKNLNIDDYMRVNFTNGMVNVSFNTRVTDMSAGWVNKDLMKAINKQMEELGWLNEEK